MKIVQSIQELYNTNLPYFKIINSKVDEVVKSNKNDRWHYESRIKQIESFAMKVEMGRFDKREIFEDLFASTIVVKNLSEISLAENFISKHFNIRFKRPQSRNFTHKDSFSFPFDDLRLYVSLKDFDTGELAPNLYEIVFEIQIKTFLQHAWSIATHDLIYKSDKINWAKERIAYQVKAALEHAEVTISGVEELSKIRELAKENKEVKKVNQLISMILNHWKPEDLPSDRRRLAQNIIGFIEAVGLNLSELNEILVLEKQQGRGTLTRNLSPFLIVVQSIFNNYPDKIINYLQNGDNRNKQKILITSEMTVPELGVVIENKLIRI
jgi:ppGpp synthetase/RelA/SpoT-type nucleotidyltranferase